ncbi:unnamed protein product [Polarella glacialis]|uniref:Uncharacterized protein n=1 Tax=Polarella glacialis TaxID=89957 RepID=A0A813GW48_POLGL|nr:unnamed protein product [Polarella glacialis]
MPTPPAAAGAIAPPGSTSGPAISDLLDLTFSLDLAFGRTSIPQTPPGAQFLFNNTSSPLAEAEGPGPVGQGSHGDAGPEDPALPPAVSAPTAPWATSAATATATPTPTTTATLTTAITTTPATTTATATTPAPAFSLADDDCSDDNNNKHNDNNNNDNDNNHNDNNNNNNNNNNSNSKQTINNSKQSINNNNNNYNNYNNDNAAPAESRADEGQPSASAARRPRQSLLCPSSAQTDPGSKATAPPVHTPDACYKVTFTREMHKKKRSYSCGFLKIKDGKAFLYSEEGKHLMLGRTLRAGC